MPTFAKRFSLTSKTDGIPSLSLPTETAATAPRETPANNGAVRGLRKERDAQKRRGELWKPDSEPQRLARESPADVIGYGGQAGGGKSAAAVGLAVTEHHRAVIFRRQWVQCGDLIQYAADLTQGYRLGLNRTSPALLTLPGGARIEFAGMEKPSDWENWKGRAKDFYAFDEVTEFLESQVRSVLGWLRSTRRGQRRRALLTFNPPTDEEGKWVIRFFAPWLDPEHANPAVDGEVRWFAMIDGEEKEVPSGKEIHHTDPKGRKEVIFPISRTFIRARLEDNRYLDSDGEYRRVLMSLPEPLRSQLLYGDFAASQKANPWQVIPTQWVLDAQKRFRERVGEFGSLEAAIKASAARQTALGVDTAHGGGDKMIIAPRYDDFIAPLTKIPGREVPDGKTAAPHVLEAWEQGADINIDAIGYGATTAEKLSDSVADGGYGLSTVNAVNVGVASTYTDRSGKYKMRNLRIELYWRLRDALDPDTNPTLCLPDDRELLADLCAPTFKPTIRGLQMESKEELRKRIHRSTDCGDAVALTMHEGGGDWGAVFGEETVGAGEWDGRHRRSNDEPTGINLPVSDAAAVDW